MSGQTPYRPSALFRHMARLQAETPWGRVLDAGTGASSLRWIASLETTGWTAVAASERERQWALSAIDGQARSQDAAMIGNWADRTFLKGEVFDTVIADYLLGALDGFSPYFQAYLFPRLRPHVGRRLYVAGLEPYVPTVRPSDPTEEILWEIGRFRDACMLLTGRLPYREYPAEWVSDHLQAAGFSVDAVKHFNIRYTARFVDAQIDMCKPGLRSHADTALAEALMRSGEDLRQKAHHHIETHGTLRAGRNYVISASPV